MTCPRLLSLWVYHEEEPDPVKRRVELRTRCRKEPGHGGRHRWV